MELDLERIAKEKGVVKEQGGEANIKNCFRICMYTGTRTSAFSTAVLQEYVATTQQMTYN